jgi:hypothetical protein
VLVNINKLKPYKFIEDKTLQLVLVKPSDLVTNELVQTKKPIPLLVEPKDFQPIGFKPISNHLTHGNIKAIDVLVHHYHNMLVWDNNVVVSNDVNVFRKALIDVYLLRVSNLKGYVHSSIDPFLHEAVQRTIAFFIFSLCFHFLLHISNDHE